MNPAITKMLASYERRSIDEHLNAFREILQEVTLCGLHSTFLIWKPGCGRVAI